MLTGLDWSGVGDTPQTVTTTRAPAVLIKGFTYFPILITYLKLQCSEQNICPMTCEKIPGKGIVLL